MKTLQERLDEAHPQIKKILDELQLDIGAEPFITPEGLLKARPVWMDKAPTIVPKEEGEAVADTPADE